MIKNKGLYYLIDPDCKNEVIAYLADIECDLVRMTMKLADDEKLSFYSCLKLESKIHFNIIKKLMDSNPDIVIAIFDGKPGFQALFN